MLSPLRCLVAVSYKLLNQYVSTYLGNIYDCYIAEYNPNSNVIVMLGSNLNFAHAQLNNSSLAMDEVDADQT